MESILAQVWALAPCYSSRISPKVLFVQPHYSRLQVSRWMTNRTTKDKFDSQLWLSKSVLAITNGSFAASPRPPYVIPFVGYVPNFGSWDLLISFRIYARIGRHANPTVENTDGRGCTLAKQIVSKSTCSLLTFALGMQKCLRTRAPLQEALLWVCCINLNPYLTVILTFLVTPCHLLWLFLSGPPEEYLRNEWIKSHHANRW